MKIWSTLMLQLDYDLGSYYYGGINRLTNAMGIDPCPTEDTSLWFILRLKFDLEEALSDSTLTEIFQNTCRIYANEDICKRLGICSNGYAVFAHLKQNGFYGCALQYDSDSGEVIVSPRTIAAEDATATAIAPAVIPAGALSSFAILRALRSVKPVPASDV